MEFLCTLIRNMSEEQRDRIVYNGRDPVSRRLADWWDEDTWLAVIMLTVYFVIPAFLMVVL